MVTFVFLRQLKNWENRAGPRQYCWSCWSSSPFIVYLLRNSFMEVRINVVDGYSAMLGAASGLTLHMSSPQMRWTQDILFRPHRKTYQGTNTPLQGSFQIDRCLERMNQVQQNFWLSTSSLQDQGSQHEWLTTAWMASRPCWAHSLPWIWRHRPQFHLRDGSQPGDRRVTQQIPRCVFLLIGHLQWTHA